MASSSTHSTAQETDLHACWRTTYIRLKAVNAHDDAIYLTEEFAAALDVSYKDLTSCYWPPGPEGKDDDVAEDEWNIHKAVKAQGTRLSTAEKINQAANAAMEAGRLLAQYGRKAESERFEDFGQELYDLAVTIAQRDRRDSKHQSSSGSDADSRYG